MNLQQNPDGSWSPAQPIASPKKSRKKLWLGLGITAIVLFLATCGGCVALGGAAADSMSKSHTITYHIDGQGKALITYVGDNFSEGQETTQLPWEKTVTVTGWQPVVLEAQLQDNSGALTCHIDVDGHVGKPVTSSGEYVVVTCSDSSVPS